VTLSPKSTRGVPLFAIQHRSPADLLPPSAALADAASVVSALDHVVITTDDADATKCLYGEGLGLRLALDKEFPAWGARQLFFRVGGVTVEVGARLEPESKPRPSDRFWGMAYQVPNAERAQERLGAVGFEVSQVRDGRKPGTRVFSVRGEPCGVPTLMIEPTPRD
jgi:catechol 2,3-dioxygenase-like lactoylglutathione lyase family enzyme